MSDKSKFEQMLEKLVADDKAAAEEIFHNIVVEKSRSIYEGLLEDDIKDIEVEETSKEESKEESAETTEASKEDKKEDEKVEEKTEETKDEETTEASKDDAKEDEAVEEASEANNTAAPEKDKQPSDNLENSQNVILNPDGEKAKEIDVRQLSREQTKIETNGNFNSYTNNKLYYGSNNLYCRKSK